MATTVRGYWGWGIRRVRLVPTSIVKSPKMFRVNGPSLNSMFIILSILNFSRHGAASSYTTLVEKEAILKVEEELIGESIPLQAGSRFYKLDGLKPFSWYEVKISYPASIPASFSIQLKKRDVEMNLNRRLLNTEKLIFKNENLENQKGGTFVLVTVEPEGVVAMKHVPDRQSIIFNIVCNELLLGLPHQAWWVGFLVFLCLVASFSVPLFLLSYLLRRNSDSAVSKDS